MAIRISQKYLDFDHKMLIMHAYVVANSAALYITNAQVEDYTTLMTEWSATLLKYTDPNLHTPGVVAQMADIYQRLDAHARMLQQQVKNNGAIEKTQAVIDNMFLHVDRERRRERPRSDIKPAIELEHALPGFARVQVIDPRQGSERHRRKPEDVDSIRLWKAYTAADAPAPEVINLEVEDNEGHAVFNVMHPEGSEGQACWLQAAYMVGNLVGPKSDPFRVLVI